MFTDEDGVEHRFTGEARHPEVGVYYGKPLPRRVTEDSGAGHYFFHFPWNSTDSDDLVPMAAAAMSIDQLMRFDCEEESGHGIFEILAGGSGPNRHPNWPPMDMSDFRQTTRPAT